MRQAARQAHTSGSGSFSSPSSSTQSLPGGGDCRQATTKDACAASASSVSRKGALLPKSSDTARASTVTADGAEGAATAIAHRPDKGTFTESERRRQTALFLDESEQFAFDFGGAVAEIAETIFEADAAERAARRAEELEDTTARVLAASALHATTPPRLLTLEEVNAYAADAMQQGPPRFLRLATAGSRKRAAPKTSSIPAPQDGPASVDSALPAHKQAEDADGATLAEAIPQFQAALCRYEADLWRAHKQRREEEARQRSKKKHSQNA
ncbi:hypothetical protein LSCM1_06141 [Leishmania martiniquensis]|uniref:Uncharacterized protein n=1 Tax=Leishmania martiniquensis TaxID=1580590 RepID=A0A836GB71_9TRYP|nr:hypothetical protein LSCM1_06141 [Leishmania martiniquensis]